jgi:glycosyltransferase involved in cell wall biosynthesis
MTRPRRLLLLCTAGSIGGTERVVLSLARQFARRGWHVRAIFAEDIDRDALLEWAHRQGVQAETHRAVKPIASPRSLADMRALRRLVRDERPDVVNVHYGGNHLSIKDVLAVRAAGVRRCVVSPHLPTPWADVSSRKRMATRLAAALSHRVVAHSAHMKAVMREAGISDARIVVVHNGVPEPAPAPCREDARAKLGLARDSLVVGSMGRLVPIKGMDDLVRAVALVAGATLAIGGDGPDRASLEQLADECMPGRLRILGVSDPDVFFAAVDVFALASHLEGLPMTLLEASMHGVPSVATDVGAANEAIEHGVSGLLVPDRNVEALAAAIQRLATDTALLRRMGTGARERASAWFTESAMADGYEAVFAR